MPEQRVLCARTCGLQKTKLHPNIRSVGLVVSDRSHHCAPEVAYDDLNLVVFLGTGTNVHTNCRSIAQICFPCTERLHISYSQNFRFEKITGTVVCVTIDDNALADHIITRRLAFRENYSYIRCERRSGNTNGEQPRQHSLLIRTPLI